MDTAQGDLLDEDYYPDPFAKHPLSYPLLSANDQHFYRSSSRTPSTVPSLVEHGSNVSSNVSSNPSSNTSSHTSWNETSWFNDDDAESVCEVQRKPIIDPKPDINCTPWEAIDPDCTPWEVYDPDDCCVPSPNDSQLSLSCAFDKSDWFAQFDGQLDVSDDPPSREVLAEAGEIPLYDSAGNTRLFKTLFSRGEVVGSRQLIIFIRHFYCGACKAYIDALSANINNRDTPLPTSIAIVGCGSPELIRHYKATTQCPFPIFADPSRSIFRLLGMHISLNMFGRRRPKYMADINLQRWMGGQLKDVSSVKGKKRFMGGNVMQIGGEFLFENGEVTWCHRMRNYRGHAEVDVIKRILDITR
ncbi:hypothetical protein K461DRAFT_231206 [Myriangium duriaei CBS 260.36]|uniref:Thioredoxin domain-containing protein n=1 Tax=Myriangium duriaei CBS 260.36 TaxID=1168546 RepID=A0A9P4MIY3_9PEZI|nr:hypothetical protein K461DRAFT_231206 [Myriangium duriaei CBS 260.36]